LDGEFLLLAFDAGVLRDLNIPLAGAADRLVTMSPSELEQLFSPRTAVWWTLTPSRAAWVPYGWVPICIALNLDGDQPGKISTAAALPVFDSSLLHSKGNIMASFLHSLEAFGRQPMIASIPERAARWQSDSFPTSNWLSCNLHDGSVSASEGDEEAATEEEGGPHKRARKGEKEQPVSTASASSK
jgi:hypothetical protein